MADLTGKHFGKWTVLAPSEKPRYYTCQCECGVVKDVYDSSLRLGKSHSCLSCANRGQKPAMTETALRKAKKKEGQIINGWKVLEVLPEKRSCCFLCRAICPKCGEGNHRKDHKAFSNPALRRLQQGHWRENRGNSQYSLRGWFFPYVDSHKGRRPYQ